MAFAWCKFSRFSRAEQSMRTLKLGETPTHRYFTCKVCGGCGFLALKREYYMRALKPFRENLHPRQFPAIIMVLYANYKAQFSRFLVPQSQCGADSQC